ncbi:hypothetical protein ABZW32_19135 [Streptomyces sp. NPDC004667]|uniref:hypothetical protein n=1 Tax=Streptomyces sp. NPDC004667 TaxID=3154285 RepID=UPI0033BBA112
MESKTMLPRTSRRIVGLSTLLAASTMSVLSLSSPAYADDQKEITAVLDVLVNGKKEVAVKPGEEVEFEMKVHALNGHTFMTRFDFEVPAWLEYTDGSVSMNGKQKHEWAGFEDGRLSGRFATTPNANEHWWGSVGPDDGESVLRFKGKAKQELGEKESFSPTVTYKRGTAEGLPIITATDVKAPVVRHVAADLAVTGKANGPATAGGILKTRADVLNKGADEAKGVKYEASVSGTGTGTKIGASAVLPDQSKKPCEVTAEKVVCDLGDVAAGKSAAVDIDVTVPEDAAGRTLKMSGHVNSSTKDFHPDNNAWQMTETVAAAVTPPPTAPAPTSPSAPSPSGGPTAAPTPVTSVSGSTTAPDVDGGDLASTGADDVLPLAGAGTLVLGTGAALVYYARRRQAG